MRRPTLQKLQRLLSYSIETGEFFWLVSPSHGVKAGDRAGTVKGNGYRYITIKGVAYLEHRLAFLFVTGAWPTSRLDHHDANFENNLFSNLRLATQSQNLANARIRSDNTSGTKGVSWDQRRSRWVAQIHVMGKTKFLGRFDHKDAAAAAYLTAAVAVFGEFARAA